MNTFLRAVLPALASAGLVFAFVLWRKPPERPAPSTPPPIADVAAAPVLYGRDAEYEVLVRPRRASSAERAFVDRALAEALDVRGDVAAMAFVEVLVRRVADGTGVPPPGVRFRTTRSATPFAPTPLADLRGDRADGRAAMLIAAFSPPADAPLGNGTLRRVVYGLPLGVVPADLAGGEAAGVALRRAVADPRRFASAAEDPAVPLAELLADEGASRPAAIPSAAESRR